MRIGVLRGRENSFPDAFVAKANSMGHGVAAEHIHLGGTKLNEPVPYRVVLDRISHEVPYYASYLKMAALQGTYVINNVFARPAEDKFLGYAFAEKLGIFEPRTVLLPNRGYGEDVTGETLRNLWPTDFARYAEYVGLPCYLKPVAGGGWKDVAKVHNLEELVYRYDESGQRTMMLQEVVPWETFVRVLCVGRRWARAIRYDPSPMGMGAYHQDEGALGAEDRERAEELALRFCQALGLDLVALDFAVRDGRFYGIDLTNTTPDLDYRSLKDHFPWVVEKTAAFAVEKALSTEPVPEPPDLRSLTSR